MGVLFWAWLDVFKDGNLDALSASKHLIMEEKNLRCLLLIQESQEIIKETFQGTGSFNIDV